MATAKKRVPIKKSAAKAGKPTTLTDITEAGESAPRARVGINMSALIASEAGEVKQPTESGEKVTVSIPKDFILTLADHTQVKYGAGIDEMPVEHSEHWYSKAMGVEVYDPKKKE